MSQEWCTDLTLENFSCNDTCGRFGLHLCGGKLIRYTFKEQKYKNTEKPTRCCCTSQCDPSPILINSGKDDYPPCTKEAIVRSMTEKSLREEAKSQGEKLDYNVHYHFFYILYSSSYHSNKNV